MEKPICIYIPSDYYSDDHEIIAEIRDVLAFVCENDYGIRFLDLEIEQLKSFQVDKNEEILFFVILDSDKYFVDDTISFLKLNYFNVPILLDGQRGDNTDPSLMFFSFYNSELPLFKIITQLVESFYFKKNYFGNLSLKDRDSLISNLSKIYKNRLEEEPEGDLGAGDYNHQLTAELMRIRIFSSGISKAFDEKLDRVAIGEFGRRFPSFDKKIIEEKLQKIKGMTKKERENLWIKMMTEQNLQPSSRGGFISLGIGLGNNNYRFIFDTCTGLFQINGGFGAHAYTMYQLRSKLELLESVESEHVDRSRTFDQGRFIEGLILTEVDYDNIPFLQMTEKFLEEEKWIIDFLKRERRFILVDFEGNLL